MKFHIVTLFKESIDSYLNESIIARAIKNKKISVNFLNPRDFVSGKYKKKWPDGNEMRQVDGRPYGGGPGMVIMAEPVIKAGMKAITKAQKANKKIKTIFLSPSGKQFTTLEAQKLSKKYDELVIICGRYEGIDSRAKKILKAEEYSIGPYVLTGGELPAMVMVDSISRQIDGVLNKIESLEERRVSSSDVYTRPEVLEYDGKKYKVPKVLLSGHRAKIEEWKKSSK